MSTMQAQARICPACYDDHDSAQNCRFNEDSRWTCQECGSNWQGYHTWTFCKLTKAGLPWNAPTRARMAFIADGKGPLISNDEATIMRTRVQDPTS